ncbi:MAG: 50S ribosomal protein L17 [Salinivirgaceae bacterium]|jgi:large subunit ribosomal protein L17|nr:50S ribosomal protein L17 [Salinivirgaceae bacterium]
MRHNKSFNHLGRKTAHRNAMLSNMATSLILHKRINTTVAKAKALKCYVEPLITKSKVDSTHSRRVVFSYLQNKDSVSELFRDIAVKVATRPGGYTRILKTGTRAGDSADMCIIELVDYNENYTQGKDDAKKKASRKRRGGKKATPKAEAANTEVVETVEAPEAEVKAAEEAPVAAEKARSEEKVEAKAEESKDDIAEEDKKED